MYHRGYHVKGEVRELADQTGGVKHQKKCIFCGVPLTKKESGTCKFCKKFN